MVIPGEKGPCAIRNKVCLVGGGRSGSGTRKKVGPVKEAEENFRRVERKPQKNAFGKQWLRPLTATL